MVVLPARALRQRVILKRLRRQGAVSPETASSLQEVGMLRPNLFPKVTEALIRQGKLAKTASGTYYLLSPEEK